MAGIIHPQKFLRGHPALLVKSSITLNSSATVKSPQIQLLPNSVSWDLIVALELSVIFVAPKDGALVHPVHLLTRFHQQGRVAPKELLWMDYTGLV